MMWTGVQEHSVLHTLHVMFTFRYRIFCKALFSKYMMEHLVLTLIKCYQLQWSNSGCITWWIPIWSPSATRFCYWLVSGGNIFLEVFKDDVYKNFWTWTITDFTCNHFQPNDHDQGGKAASEHTLTVLKDHIQVSNLILVPNVSDIFIWCLSLNPLLICWHA